MPVHTLDLSFDLACAPEAVRTWWLDLPDDYRSTDPAEQPHRIRVVDRAPGRLEVDTYWRGPFGRDMKVRETLHEREGGAWTADLIMMGYRIHDEFHATPREGGARLTIHSEITPANPVTRLLAPVILPGLKKAMRRTWRDAARICEEEAR